MSILLLETPRLIGESIKVDDRVKALAYELAKAKDVLYLGRGRFIRWQWKER